MFASLSVWLRSCRTQITARCDSARRNLLKCIALLRLKKSCTFHHGKANRIAPAFAFCITVAFVPFPFNDVVLNVHITIRQHFNFSFAQNLKIFNELHSKYQTKRNYNTANWHASSRVIFLVKVFYFNHAVVALHTTLLWFFISDFPEIGCRHRNCNV